MLYPCVLLYITLIYIRPAEINPEWAAIPFVDIFTVIAAILTIFSLAAKPRSFANLPHDKLLIIFWVLMGVSTAKVWLQGVLNAWLAFTPVIVCYFLIRASVTSQRKLLGLVYLLLALNVFLAINGIVQYHTGVGFGNATMRMDRIYGTGIFSDPNDLGMTFVMSVPLFIYVIGRSGYVVVVQSCFSRGPCCGAAGAVLHKFPRCGIGSCGDHGLHLVSEVQDRGGHSRCRCAARRDCRCGAVPRNRPRCGRIVSSKPGAVVGGRLEYAEGLPAHRRWLRSVHRVSPQGRA